MDIEPLDQPEQRPPDPNPPAPIGKAVMINFGIMLAYMDVCEQDALELEDGLVVYHDCACMLWMLLPVDLVVCVLRLLLL